MSDRNFGEAQVLRQIDQELDRIVGNAFRIEPPETVYHYTKWPNAYEILRSRLMLATAHDCMDDTHELLAADGEILRVANDLRASASNPLAAEVLGVFIEQYPRLKPSEMVTAYLSCFSAVVDDGNQWCRFGDGGSGVCLGIRVLRNEHFDNPPGIGSWLAKVYYSEEEWRPHLERGFSQVCSVLEDPGIMSHNGILKRSLALSTAALYRIAGLAAISVKHEEYSSEQELRRVTVTTPRANLAPSERGLGARRIRYIPTALRNEGRLIALSEVKVGPNQDQEAGRAQVERVLAEAGYGSGSNEFPVISLSQAPRC